MRLSDSTVRAKQLSLFWVLIMPGWPILAPFWEDAFTLFHLSSQMYDLHIILTDYDLNWSSVVQVVRHNQEKIPYNLVEKVRFGPQKTVSKHFEFSI